MKANRGFTLIEMAVVLAIIAILAAILTPIVTGYIDQARDVRSRGDVRQIMQAVLLHQRDTGRFPIYDTTAQAVADTAARQILVSGPSAALPALDAGSPPAGWSGSTVGLLTSYLNVNTLGVSSSGGSGGVVNYRGPYLDGLAGTDPWGQPYAVTATNLRRSSANFAYVISAGPDGDIDTARDIARTGNFSATGDDITGLIK
jgi:prepilin-type N-terminal cleavage/methylation domain-containing protein